MESGRPKTSTTRLARGTTRQVGRATSQNCELNMSIKQLIPPSQPIEQIKEVVTTNLNKPDIHLRADLLKPTEMYHIDSPTRRKGRTSPAEQALELDDESKNSPDKYNFDEMVRIGRPDRDTSLRKPLMRTLQTLRRYKLGTSPSLKAGLLRETLDPIVQHPGTKRLLSGMSPRGRPISPLLPFPSAPAPQLADNNMLAEDGSQLMPMTRSAPNLHASKIELEKEKERTLTVREISEVSLHRYHLSAQGRRSAQVLTRGHTGNNTMTDGLVTDSIDSSVLAGGGAGGEGEDDPNMNDEVPVLYDPATVRLPRMEIVPGFGSTTPLVESRLGAYHVHSNRAVSAAAALEDASLIEGSRALSMNSRQDDSYRAERVEAFYKSAETSHLDSLEQQAAHMQIQCPGGASVGSRSASSQESTIRSPHIATEPPAPAYASATNSPSGKKRLHCGKCFKDADLWCQRCASAFCGVCWGQVAHHDLQQMSPSRTEQQRRPNTTAASSSPNKTYAKSVLFQTYTTNAAPVPGAQLENSRYSSTAAAKIPLPEFVIVQYDQYPAPPVYIDGKGHVLEDIIKRRPVTAPVQTQEDLHKLQIANHFKRQSQQEQYHQMLALKYKAATIGIPNGAAATSSAAGAGATSATPGGTGFPGKSSSMYPSLGVTSGIHYEKVEPRPLTHSKGRVVVRKNKKKHPVLRPSSPNLAATPHGTLSLGYAPKPRTGTKPMTGILKDGTPDDWKTALFASNDIKDSGRKASLGSGSAKGLQ